MAAWFGKGRQDGRGVGSFVDTEDENPDDTPTGQISAQLIADAVAGANAKQAPADVERLRDERAALIQLCLYALDRARSGGVVERLEEGLAGIGVTALRPDGERFDPAQHEAGGTVSTSDSGLDGIVAETEVVGFTDSGQVLRAPIVTVYATRQGTR